MKRKPKTDTAAGQEADRSQAALENTRQGYGRDRSAQDIEQPPKRGPESTPQKVARRHGERNR